MEIVVTTGFGVETATKLELKKLGIDAPCNNGKFIFDGSALDVARCNYLLRTADRVYIRLANFVATSFDQLFDGVKEVFWHDIIDGNGAIIVNAKSLDSKLFSLRDIQSITKKAIVTKMLTKVNILKEDGLDFKIDVLIVKDEVSILLDTSGNGLHKRGYRTLVYEAPIRETLAAAMLTFSVWNKDRQLIDPFVGSGTIAIEAAMIGLNIPCGYFRTFSFENYRFINKSHLKETKQIANEMINWDTNLRISGYDINKKAIQLANTHANNCGLSKYIHLETQDMRQISSRFKYGVIVTNPPYGERLMEESELKILYKDLGKLYRSLDSFSLYAITPYPLFEKCFGKYADKKRKIFNASIQCNLYQYLGAKPPKTIITEQSPTEDLVSESSK